MVPNWWRISPFLNDLCTPGRTIQLQRYTIEKGIPWRRDFKYSGIVKRFLRYIKVWINPFYSEAFISHWIFISAWFKVHRIGDRRKLAVIIDLSIPWPGNIIDFFMKLALLINPTFDNLNLNSLRIHSLRSLLFFDSNLWTNPNFLTFHSILLF